MVDQRYAIAVYDYWNSASALRYNNIAGLTEGIATGHAPCRGKSALQRVTMPVNGRAGKPDGKCNREQIAAETLRG